MRTPWDYRPLPEWSGRSPPPSSDFEGHLRERVTALEVETRHMVDRVSSQSERLHQADRRFNALEGRVQSMEQRSAAQEERKTEAEEREAERQQARRQVAALLQWAATLVLSLGFVTGKIEIEPVLKAIFALGSVK